MPMEYGSIDGIIWITIGLGVTAQAKSIYSLGIQVADGRWAMEWRRYDNGPLEDNDSLRTCFFAFFP